MEMSFFGKLAGHLEGIRDNPVGLVAFLALLFAATFLFIKYRQIRSLDAATKALPEKDRLAAIEHRYRTLPRKGISADAWLKSRRQVFLFSGYVATLLCALVVLAMVLQRTKRRPGGAHHQRLRESYAIFHTKMSAFILEARNLRNAFSLAGERAVAPDPKTDADLTAAIAAYNGIYKDLRTNRAQYLGNVTRWLEEQPDLAARIQSTLSLALDRVHRLGTFKLNDLYRRMVKVRDTSTKSGPDPERSTADSERLAREKSDGLEELSNTLETINQELTALEQQFANLSIEVQGHV